MVETGILRAGGGVAIMNLGLVRNLRTGFAAGTVACAWLTIPAAQNLYEWMGVAPTVILGTVVVDDQRYVEVEVTKQLVGETLGSGILQIDEKSANRDRDRAQAAVRMEKGASYLILLEPMPPGRKGGPPRYRLVRGVLGVRQVAPEGGAVFVDAAERLAQVHALRDDSRRWLAFEQMFEETNPFLLRAALDIFLKFRRGLPAHISLLRPLLDHPEAEVRASAARLIAQIVGAYGTHELPEESSLAAELIGRARRDESTEVRVAATECLASIGGASAEAVLRDIARQDPEQDVRYAAQRILHEKNLGKGLDPPKD